MAVLGPVDGPGPIMVGYLDKFSMTGLVKRWNRRWFVLYGPKSEGHVRMEYFDDEVSQLNESGRRVIPLRECRSCSQVTSMKSRAFVFQCTTHIGHHLFAAAGQEEVDCWVKNVRAAVKTHLASRQRKGSKQKTSSSSISSWTSAALPAGVVLQELVTVVPSDGAQKANLSGQYLLNVVAKGMTLHDTSSHDRVALWEFRTIKSYGKSHNDFNFETGRSSRYGVARFVFECNRTREVFRAVNDSIKYLAHAQTSRKSAPDLHKEQIQKQRPSRAHSMYVTGTLEEPQTSDTSGTSSSTHNTSCSSVYLENPLQQLRAIHSMDLPCSPASGGSAVASPSPRASSASPPGVDYSDHFKELESPPSYQDALQLQANSTWDSIIKQSSTDSDVQVLSALADSSVNQTGATPSGRHVFGADPFSSFTGNDHSFASSSPHTQRRNRDSTEGFPLQDPFAQPRNRDSMEGFPLQDPFVSRSSDSTEVFPLQGPFRQPRNRDSTEGFPLQDPFRQPRNSDSTEGFPPQDPFKQPRNRDSAEGFPLQDPFRQPKSRDSTEGFPLQDPFRQPRNSDSTEGFPLQDPFRQPKIRDSTEGFPLQDPFRQQLHPFTTSSPANPQGIIPFEDLSPFLDGDQVTSFDDIDDSLFAQLALLDLHGTSPGDK